MLLMSLIDGRHQLLQQLSYQCVQSYPLLLHPRLFYSASLLTLFCVGAHRFAVTVVSDTLLLVHVHTVITSTHFGGSHSINTLRIEFNITEVPYAIYAHSMLWEMKNRVQSLGNCYEMYCMQGLPYVCTHKHT